jgi:hypothetical protein
MAHGETTELLRDGADFMSPADLLPEQVRVIQEALSELDVVSALPAITPRPPLGRVELRIEVRFSDAEREPLELSFGEVLAQGPRARQRVRADGIPYDFAFDRASILRLLDLL